MISPNGRLMKSIIITYVDTPKLTFFNDMQIPCISKGLRKFEVGSFFGVKVLKKRSFTHPVKDD
jgi:hypothetical protein